jgi:transcriptional regulator with XRE-family HTH domain
MCIDSIDFACYNACNNPDEGIEDVKISHKQMKAARAMLDWSRAELAAVSGVSEPNLLRLEAGGDARPETMRKIVEAFERSGVAFNNNGGVDPSKPEVKTFQTAYGLQALLDDVYNVVKTSGGDICITGVVEKDFSTTIGHEFDQMHMERMSELKNYSMRCLIEEGDTNFEGDSYCEYRWTRKDEFVSIPFYIYGNKVAFIQFDAPIDAPIIVLIQSKPIVDAFRMQFESMWKSAKIPPKGKQK